MTGALKERFRPGGKDTPDSGALIVALISVALALGASRFTGNVMLAVFPALFLGFFLSHGPLIMCLRSWVVHAVAIMVTVTMGALFVGNPYLTALGLAIVGFFGSVVQTLPLMGRTLGLVTGVLYLVFVVDALAAHAGVSGTVAATGAGLVAVLIALLVVKLPDPSGPLRGQVSAALRPEGTIRALGAAAITAALDGASSVPGALIANGVSLKTGRRLAAQADAQSAQVAELDRATNGLADSLGPRGRWAPRAVPHPALPELSQPTSPAEFGVATMSGALTRMRGVLEGSTDPMDPLPVVRRGVLDARIRAGLQPGSSWFRYGVQRAVALGVATVVAHLAIGIGTNAFWVLLATFLILQPHARTTKTNAVRRMIATMAGVLVAVLLSLVLPDSILFPCTAILLLVYALSLTARNPVVLIALTAAASVLLVGVPDTDVPSWALLRLLDTAVGGVWALAVSVIVLPLHPDPAKLVATIQSKSRAGLHCLTGISDTVRPEVGELTSADMDLELAITDAEQAVDVVNDQDRAYLEERLDASKGILDDLRAVGSLALAMPESSALPDALANVDHRIEGLTQPTPSAA